MTDEPQSSDPAEGAAPQEQPSVEDTAPAETDVFTSGEGLVALAGIVLLAVWLLFDVILDDFGVGILELSLAVLVVAAPRINRDAVEAVHRLPVIMKAAGYAIAVVGAIHIVGDLEDGFFEGISTIIAALIVYVAYAMAFIGARSIEI